MRKFSPDLLETMKKLEGFRSKPYKDQKGVWTIGYGHTAAAGYPDPRQVTKLTKSEAEQILIKDLTAVADSVDKLIKVKLPQNRLEGIYSFAYNVGVHAFARSTLLKYINHGEYDKVEEQIRRWCYVDKKINKGLQNRREEEIKLWERLKERLPSKRNAALSVSGLTALSAEVVEILKANNTAQILFIAGLVVATTGLALGVIYFEFFKSKK